MKSQKKASLPEAMKHFESLSGEPPANLEYWGIRTNRSPKGKKRIHLTAVPFQKDGVLAKLAAEAQIEGEPKLAFVLQADPDEDLEALLDRHKRKIGPWTVNPYDNVVITTFHPDCAIKTDLSNAPPKLKALVEHIERHYLHYDDFQKWGKKAGLLTKA